MATKKGQEQNELPTITEVLDQILKPGTVLVYPEKKMVFKNSPQVAVKSLEVNICSTEVLDMAILHKLHTQTRTA